VFSIRLEPRANPRTGGHPQKNARVAPYIRSHYTKFEYRIPMRDGVHLFTSVYVPSDASPKKTYPITVADAVLGSARTAPIATPATSDRPPRSRRPATSSSRKQSAIKVRVLLSLDDVK
jgi:predicted acyl esterase